MNELDNVLQSHFDRLNLRMKSVTHSSPKILESAECDRLWKEFVNVSNEYKPEYTDEEKQAVIDAIAALLKFLSDK